MQNKRLLEYALVVAAVLIVLVALYYGQAQPQNKIPGNTGNVTAQSTISASATSIVSTTSVASTTSILVNASTGSSTLTTTIPNTGANATGGNGTANNSTLTNTTANSAGPGCQCLGEPQLQTMLNDSYAEGLNSTYVFNRTQDVYNGTGYGFNITAWNTEYSAGTYTEQTEGLSYTVMQNDPIASASYFIVSNRTNIAYTNSGAFSRTNGTINGLTYTIYNAIFQVNKTTLRSAYFIGYYNKTYVMLNFNTQNTGAYTPAEIANVISYAIRYGIGTVPGTAPGAASNTIPGTAQ